MRPMESIPATPHPPEDLEIKDARLIFNAVWQSLEDDLGHEQLRFPKEIILLGGAPGAGKGTNTQFIMRARGLTCPPIVVSDLLDSPEARKIKDAGGMVGDREVVSILLREMLDPKFRDGAIRTYHVGDTEVLLFGGQGKMKLQTLAHSPVAYAVEAGLLNEEEAMNHRDRHLVTNVLGDSGMRVEMSSLVKIAPRDTVVGASDGLTDNMHSDEIVQGLRAGPLAKQMEDLVQECRTRMVNPGSGKPSKPDDLTVLAFRPPKA